MFDYIKGTFSYKSATSKGCYATVEAAGVGYSIEIMERDYNRLPELNEELKIYTVLLHREDKMSLCGFIKREERDIFNILTSVSGVGSKMALALLNTFETSELIGFVLDGNYKGLTGAKGVGPKLAQKIILELKDKLTSYQGTVPLTSSIKTTIPSSQNVEDAQMVLLSLGYTNDEIAPVMGHVLEKLSTTSPAEEILKESLKLLSL